MKFPHVLTAFFNGPWAIEETKYYQIRELLMARATGHVASREEIDAIVAANRRGPDGYQVVGKTAVIPIMGVIAPRVSMMDEASGGVGAEDIGKQFDAAIDDKTVNKILLHIDSPGGSVYGVQELGDKIRAGAKEKKVISIADHVAASAAYWLGAQATEFYVTPSGQAGALGVISEHVDVSKMEEMIGMKTTLIRAGEFKQETHPSVPLTTEAAAEVQKTVNVYYDAFINAVAKGRNTTPANVRENYGKGRMLTSGEAKSAGMVDGVVTFEKLLARLGTPSQSAIAARMRTLEIDA